jgi:hypothetical protein
MRSNGSERQPYQREEKDGNFGLVVLGSPEHVDCVALILGHRKNSILTVEDWSVLIYMF